MITGINDILEEINISFSEEKIKSFFDQKSRDGELLKGLSDDEKRITECIRLESMHIDAIARRTGMKIEDVGALLVMLELKGIVEQSPGKIFSIKF